MRSGRGWSRCCRRTRGRVAAGMTTAWWSTGSCSGAGRAARGVTCPRSTYWKTVYNRHRRWSGDGTWEKILDCLRAGCDEAEGEAWTVAADATVVRAHRSPRAVRSKPGQPSRRRPPPGPALQKLGRPAGEPRNGTARPKLGRCTKPGFTTRSRSQRSFGHRPTATATELAGGYRVPHAH